MKKTNKNLTENYTTYFLKNESETSCWDDVSKYGNGSKMSRMIQGDNVRTQEENYDESDSSKEDQSIDEVDTIVLDVKRDKDTCNFLNQMPSTDGGDEDCTIKTKHLTCTCGKGFGHHKIRHHYNAFDDYEAMRNNDNGYGEECREGDQVSRMEEVD